MNNKYKILEIDPYLSPYECEINLRMDRLNALKVRLFHDSSLDEFSSAYEFYGFHKTKEGYVYREWAPSAVAMYLIGDFNDWNRYSHPMRKIDDENWEITVSENLDRTKVKVRVIGKDGYDMDRIPLYINYAVRDENNNFSGQVFESNYDFKIKKFAPKFNAPLIYECHIGMATEREGVGTYDEFRTKVLPNIAKMGFNTLQIMGIMEHPYYGSFGYQVSNFFAPCSLFGNPNDLKRLIDDAHELGIAVLLDLVHSHAVSNIFEGINRFDGSPDQFFLGDHPAWGSKVFDYSKEGVIKFLLSNIRYYLKEFNFDGFRFDGVTSMLYTHYGLGVAFDNYGKYFSMSTNLDAINYLQLATELSKKINPNSILISEDMSGMPGMCLPVEWGGMGFDYRLMMGSPDLWIRLIKKTKDEEWNMNEIYHELVSRRPCEKAIGYAESHDQALVGDKTIIFRLCDKEMYWHMQKSDNNLEVERGVALYKLIYGITMTLGGDGYLNFMGNEFGHPEWIDFPREGNGYSYKYARRQWSLRDDQNLKYWSINEFNKDLLNIVKTSEVLGLSDRQIYIDQNRKIIAYQKGNLLFAMSFHPNYSEPDMFLPLHSKQSATLVFTSDDSKFLGHDRIKKGEEHLSINRGGSDGVSVYIPSRTFNIFELK